MAGDLPEDSEPSPASRPGPGSRAPLAREGGATTADVRDPAGAGAFPTSARVRIGVAVLDRDLRHLYVNDLMPALDGVAAADHIGRTLPELFPNAPARILTAPRSVLETGRPIDGVLANSPNAGSGGPDLVVGFFPLRDAGDGVSGVMIVVTDATGPVRLAERVQREARRAELLADFHHAVAAVIDEREIFKIAAEKLVSLDGDSCAISMLSEDERHLEPVVVAAGTQEHVAFGRDVVMRARESVADAVDGDVVRSGRSLFLPVVGDDVRRRYLDSLPESQRRRAGRFTIGSLISVPLRFGGQPIGAIRLVRMASNEPFDRDDLEFVEQLAERVSLAADRSRTHRALAETAATLGAVLRASPLASVVLDNRLRIVSWNPAAEKMFGWREDELLGREIPFIDTMPDEVANMRARTVAGEVFEGVETTRIAKDGHPVDVAIYASSFFDAQGLEGYVIRFADITQRKQLEAELLQSQKIESIGRLAGGVAHDFNNILTAVIGYADLGLMDLGEQRLEDTQRDLESIKAAAQRASGLTQQLLAFSRRQVLVPEVVDANEIVLGMESMLRRLIGEHIDLRIVLDPDAGSLRADPTQLQQVILNLALNARDAMPAGGELRIATGRTRFDETIAKRHLELLPGDYVMISVSDSGVGMDAETKSRIFEPFFTTKERGKGTGLGLATTYGIVRQSEGHIWVSSEIGRGTEFTLYFPSAAPQPSEAAVHEHVAEGRRSERVLLVEDEPALRDLSRLVLLRQGYSLMIAANAADALATLDAQPDIAIDLLVTDVVMPGISGPELARRLIERFPTLRVLLVSGYSDEMIANAGTVPGAAFLAKPFTPEALLAKVSEVLAQAGRAAAIELIGAASADPIDATAADATDVARMDAIDATPTARMEPPVGPPAAALVD